MIKSADIQQLGVGLGSLSNIVCTYFFQEQQHGHPSFFHRYLQLNFLREQSTTDFPITVVWFISNDKENVICDTNGPNMNRVVRKPAFCICENKHADQLRGNHEAD